VSPKENVLGFRAAGADREFETLLRRTSIYLKSTNRPTLIKMEHKPRPLFGTAAKRSRW
jgi:hypothetical protein